MVFLPVNFYVFYCINNTKFSAICDVLLSYFCFFVHLIETSAVIIHEKSGIMQVKH